MQKKRNINHFRKSVVIEEKPLFTHIIADLKYDEIEKDIVKKICQGH